MNKYLGLPGKTVRNARAKKINLDLTMSILSNCNSGKYDSVTPVKVSGIPRVDGRTIVSLAGKFSWTMKIKEAEENLESAGWNGSLNSLGKTRGDKITFDIPRLYQLGLALLPQVSYGILNGGSATSFFDHRKNSSYNPALFKLYEREFLSSAEKYGGLAKGLTPGFYNRDGSPGPSFIELKMRNALIHQLKLGHSPGPLKALFPLFQMTSVHNDREVQAAYNRYRESPVLKPLINRTETDVTHVLTGIQPLLGAFTHSREGKNRELFTQAGGKSHSPLPLPGGHGQNFMVLKDIYKKLKAMGKRYVYLGNVDNLGNTPNPASIALLAVTGRDAGFDFSFKTPVDVKGGILVYDQRGRLNCADIGAAVSEEEVHRHEDAGETILFNCATGLFNLEYLTDNIEKIMELLPMRISDQEKDSGSYSQAEQITWEIIGMLDNFFIFAVEKYERFLAAKLAMETCMTSGLKLDHPRFPAESLELAENLNRGLRTRLTAEYGMEEQSGKWIPIPVERMI